MQAHYHKIPHQFHQSIAIRKDNLPYFHDTWHYHTKSELVYIVKGEGTRFIGDDISGFTSGDLVLLGPGLPHVWKSEEDCFKAGSNKKVEAIVLHFSEDMGGNAFWELPEMNELHQLLNQSHQGINYTVAENHPVKKLLKKMLLQEPFERFLTLLVILKQLAAIDKRRFISRTTFADQYRAHQSKRIDKVYAYILNNFDREIKLEYVAALANMTSASFCRFFKQKTRRTLSQFTNEVRVGYACKLIIEGRYTISDICFKVGYNNLSYFNRQFKKVTGKSPSQYVRKKRQFEASQA